MIVPSLLGDHETSASIQSYTSSFTLEIGMAFVDHMPWSPFLSRFPLLQMVPTLVSVINQVVRGNSKEDRTYPFPV